ncbi:3-phosphoserine/phosphohydroxythreonine transaminase [Saccharicrinis sp. FJH2]|uniref:3-phosphoserine/phosphohydroxythreonine transaminase n=1 Tax=unclassified Saccharicrinis TaxID=2646859 RepID=UPI0035D52652
MKKHNFYAGPSILSEYAIKNTADAVLNFEGSGLSILEISHRSKEFIAVMSEAQALVKELLDLPYGYQVLFLGGGASTQFCMVPYNLLKEKAAYLDTGAWAAKAIKEAKFFGETEVVASSKDGNYCYIPKGYEVPKDADYFHYTSNNTIYGTEIKSDPDVEIPLVADMSSDIFSRPIDVSKYAVIYGGAQKNLGPAGTAFVIVNENLLGHVDRAIPTILDYRTHISKESMFNTPPCAPIYTSLQTLKWYKQLGGIPAIEKIKKQKSDLLYGEIDSNKLFEGTVKSAEDRSDMNVTFVMKEEYKDLEADFLALASQKGIVGIKGHRSVGGFRASIYNAMPIESVQVLVDAMKEFEKKI